MFYLVSLSRKRGFFWRKEFNFGNSLINLLCTAQNLLQIFSYQISRESSKIQAVTRSS